MRITIRSTDNSVVSYDNIDDFYTDESLATIKASRIGRTLFVNPAEIRSLLTEPDAVPCAEATAKKAVEFVIAEIGAAFQAARAGK